MMKKWLRRAAAACFFVFALAGTVSAQQAKYVFYFIGDGMGINQVVATQMYLGELKGRVGTEPLCFTQFPVASFATNYSSLNAITDSAAAGTALATGRKTKNGTISMDSVGQQSFMTIAEKAKRAGKKVGVTTSVPANDATPAAFYAHQPSRNLKYEIGLEVPRAGFDLYAGSGFAGDRPDGKKDLYDVFREAGYTVARGNEDFRSKMAGAEKMVFVQDEDAQQSSLRPRIDRRPGDLTLSQITEGAIGFLMKDAGKDKGFFLMVEGGMIDWYGHGNDLASGLNEVIDLSDAVCVAYEFYKKHKDETLIVVTADHETGGLTLGTGGGHELYLKTMANQKASLVKMTGELQALRKQYKKEVPWEKVREVLQRDCSLWDGVQLTADEEKGLRECYEETFGKDGADMDKSLYAEVEPIAKYAVGILTERTKAGWTSGSHSGTVVPIFAVGVGAERFAGIKDNTQIPKLIGEIAGYGK